MKTSKQFHNGLKATFYLLSVVTFVLFPLHVCGQNVDSLLEILNRSQNVEAIDQAKKQLPQDLSKIDMHMLGVISKMKAQGINRVNMIHQQVRDRFSIPIVSLNDQGKIHAVIYVRDAEICCLLGIGHRIPNLL